ncbi:MAG: acyltransferase [Bacteroidetes bacterium]|nr:acyltransferase [Bacteroidota bacterium]
MDFFLDYLRKLKIADVLNAKDRISSIDFFRGIAIITVVIYHFERILPYGYLGVDLFFVISGFLVGGILIKDVLLERRINYFKFILQRGFKIWPSYYFFIFLGLGVAYLLYRNSEPSQIIPWWDLKRYLLFYQNYTGAPFHNIFDHVWSLCVEEHFYLVFPFLFIFIQKFIKAELRKKYLFIFMGLVIICGVLFKLLSLHYTNSKDTYSGTHNRIDALAWGAMLSLIIFNYGNRLKEIKNIYFVSLLGVVIFVLSIFIKVKCNSFYFDKIIFHSLVPFSFFLLVLGLYHYDFSRFKVIRVMAYYSYNWYLWHTIFTIVCSQYIGVNVVGLITYLIITFTVAVFATVIVEEPTLAIRGKILKKIFD